RAMLEIAPWGSNVRRSAGVGMVSSGCILVLFCYLWVCRQHSNVGKIYQMLQNVYTGTQKN
ncbi:MAG TPA: hypothetical protein VF630_19190, partial [Hymenobacter sp.]